MKIVGAFFLSAFLACWLLCPHSSAQIVTILQNFDPTTGITNADGAQPTGDALLAGDTLYSVTDSGGASGYGTLFSINTNGAGFTVLHTFSGGPDGAFPRKHLVLAGATLFGAADAGTNGGYGTIYSIATNGSGFSVLYTFTGGADGKYPRPGLAISGETLYGTANQGGVNAVGANSGGTIFSLNTNGNDFTVLHAFSGALDGQNPQGGLIATGDTLYGTARNSGPNGFGTVFSLNTNGGGFTILHSFYGHTNQDGGLPDATMHWSGDSLYGTTSIGGSNGSGTVFLLTTNGLTYSVLHHFKSATDGATLEAGLALAGNTLFGVANRGGTKGNGTLFSLNTDGSSFTVLHHFTGSNLGPSSNSDGAWPFGDLAICGNFLYGTTQVGGTNAIGTIFRLEVVPSITSITVSGADVVLTVMNGLAGHSYHILSSADLKLLRTEWNPVGAAVLSSGGSFSIVATNAAGSPRQFFTLQAN
jgi:uncharacterized repeat protein (TIGR03803 family)